MALSELLLKIFAQPRSKARQSGQAVLEYILVLIITVFLILGVMYQFNDAFKNFLDSYFGDYIACLLETGELPSLGGDGPTSAECSSPFVNFNLASGASLNGSGSGGGDGSGSGSSSGSNSKSGSGTSDGGNRKSRGSSSRAGSRSRPPSLRSSGGSGNAEGVRGRNSRGQVSRIKKTISQGSAGKPKNVGFGQASSSGGRLGRRGRIIRKRRIIYLGESYLSEDAKKKKKNTAFPKGKLNKKGESINTLRQPRFNLKVPEDRAVASAEDNSGFNFGAFIKFLLIGGILIAIFIFLGGQAVQIKKSWQKAD